MQIMGEFSVFATEYHKYLFRSLKVRGVVTLVFYLKDFIVKGSIDLDL